MIAGFYAQNQDLFRAHLLKNIVNLNVVIPAWLKIYWQNSQILTIIQTLAEWQQHSFLPKIGFLGLILTIALALLPHLSNNQAGLFAIAIAILWIFVWLGELGIEKTTEKAIEKVADKKSVPMHLPLICYWIVATFATIFSPVRREAIEGWIKLTLYLLLFASMSRVLSSGKVFGFNRQNFTGQGFAGLNWRSLFVGSYLLSALVVEIYGLRQLFFGAEELATWTDPTSELAGVTRVYSFLGNPNLLAGYLLPAIPLSVIGLILWRGWGVKCVAAIIAISAAVCVRETYSRGGLYGLYAEILALVVLLIYWQSRKNKLPKWAIPAFFGSTLAILGANILLVPSQRTRFFSAFLGNDSSSSYRLNVWAAVLKMIKARPILGIGTGNRAFNKIYPFFQRPGYSALGTYSVPLEITVETGVVGLVCYVWFVTTTFRLGWQQLNLARRHNQTQGLWIVGAVSVMIGMIVHGLVDTVWFRPQVQILWWLAAALIASFGISGFEVSSQDSINSEIPKEVSDLNLLSD